MSVDLKNVGRFRYTIRFGVLCTLCLIVVVVVVLGVAVNVDVDVVPWSMCIDCPSLFPLESALEIPSEIPLEVPLDPFISRYFLFFDRKLYDLRTIGGVDRLEFDKNSESSTPDDIEGVFESLPLEFGDGSSR